MNVSNWIKINYFDDKDNVWGDAINDQHFMTSHALRHFNDNLLLAGKVMVNTKIINVAGTWYFL